MWHAYNLIAVDDEVECTTMRKLKNEHAGELRESSSKVVKLTLRVRCEDVEYDAEGATIRVKGQNKTECEEVKLNAYHTLEIGIGRAVKIEKTAWDSVDVGRLEEAADPSATADLAAVLIVDGLANVVLVGATQTIVKGKIEASMPRKRGMALMGYEKAETKFFSNVASVVERHVDFDRVKCLVIAGPGFTKDTFTDFLKLEAVRKNWKTLQTNFSRVIKAHASSAYVHALSEVLENPTVRALISDTKAASEVKALDDFFEMLANDPAPRVLRSRARHGGARAERHRQAFDHGYGVSNAQRRATKNVGARHRRSHEIWWNRAHFFIRARERGAARANHGRGGDFAISTTRPRRRRVAGALVF